MLIGCCAWNRFVKSSRSRILATVYFPARSITSAKLIVRNQSPFMTTSVRAGSTILCSCTWYVCAFLRTSS